MFLGATLKLTGMLTLGWGWIIGGFNNAERAAEKIGFQTFMFEDSAPQQLTLSTAGLPLALSKLVSEANALGRRNQVNRVFRLALGLFLAMGTASFLVMLLWIRCITMLASSRTF